MILHFTTPPPLPPLFTFPTSNLAGNLQENQIVYIAIGSHQQSTVEKGGETLESM
jgi:hypothetical protein